MWVAEGCPEVWIALPSDAAGALGQASGTIIAVAMVPLMCGVSAWRRYDRISGLYLAKMTILTVLVHLFVNLFINY
jgi:hypothetical protein